jgi:hypothetical protein
MTFAATSKRVLPTPARSEHVVPIELPAPALVPRSLPVGRTIRRIRAAETERRNLQLEAERLQALGRVMQQD